MSCCICISTSEVGVVESLGKFDGILEPGCSCMNPCTQSLAGRMSLRVRPANISCPTKTKDNVTLTISVMIQFQVIDTLVEAAFYKFSNAEGQIAAFATNVIRGQVPTHTIDEVFLLRDELQKALKTELDANLASYGYRIVAALITDIVPHHTVKEAMNMINTNARLKIATQYKSETEKMTVIKAAEADAEAKRLNGVGLAEQRKAAIMGLQSSVEDFKGNVPDMSSKDIMSLLLMNQYFDALKDITEGGKSNVVFLPGSGSGSAEMIQGMMASRV